MPKRLHPLGSFRLKSNQSYRISAKLGAQSRRLLFRDDELTLQSNNPDRVRCSESIALDSGSFRRRASEHFCANTE